MKHDKFGLIVIIWMCLFLAGVLSFVLPIIFHGSVTPRGFVEGVVVSFAISFVISLIIPLKEWGDRAAAACRAEPDTLQWHLVSMGALTLIMGTLLSLSMAYYFMPPEARPNFFFVWIRMYPIVMIGTYISALIAAPIGVAIARKCCGVPK